MVNSTNCSKYTDEMSVKGSIFMKIVCGFIEEYNNMIWKTKYRQVVVKGLIHEEL